MAIVFLLDTNILVHLVRGDAVGETIRTIYAPTMIEPRPLICTVTEGELRSLAYQFQWGRSKANSAHFYLSYFKTVSIEQTEIYNAYAAIDAYSIINGHSNSMGKNDLWIAAVAHVTGACLMTTDTDFDHLASRFFELEWIDPSADMKNAG